MQRTVQSVARLLASRNPVRLSPIRLSSSSVIKPPDDFKFFNPDVLAGAEKHHREVEVPGGEDKTFAWPSYNERVYPPDGTYRPAFVTHMRANIKYSHEKMWYIAVLTRGKTITEALKQLEFVNLKGARVMEEILLEAQEMALKEHHFQYKTDMWVAEALTERAKIIKGYRRHRLGRDLGTVKYRYTNVFVRLEEGQPPEHYEEYAAGLTPRQQIAKFLEDHRGKRTVVD